MPFMIAAILLGVLNVEWLIGLIVVLVILLKVIASGGDWSDFFDMNARYEIWWTNFKFTAFIVVLTSVFVGGAAWVLIRAANLETKPTPSVRPRAAITSVTNTHKGPSRSKKHIHGSG
jgi:hypothetical protein